MVDYQYLTIQAIKIRLDEIFKSYKIGESYINLVDTLLIYRLNIYQGTPDFIKLIKKYDFEINRIENDKNQDCIFISLIVAKSYLYIPDKLKIEIKPFLDEIKEKDIVK
jgi:hypothetical protein